MAREAPRRPPRRHSATRRRLLETASQNGKTSPKVRWQIPGQKSDEPFYYIGALDDLKRAIKTAGRTVCIVEGEIDECSVVDCVLWLKQIDGIPTAIAAGGDAMPRQPGGILPGQKEKCRGQQGWVHPALLQGFGIILR